MGGFLGGILSGGGGSSPPTTPDYKGAAEATAAGNRVNQYTPYGSKTYKQDGTDSKGNPIWGETTTLSPAQQQLLDQQNKISLGLGGTMDKGLGYVNKTLATPFDTSKLPAEQINAGQTAQDALMARINPQFDRQQSQLETQLTNQGLSRGTEAWKNATNDLSNQRTDASLQAALQGMNIGQQARQQSLEEQSFLRNEPINMLNAVRSGAQVTGPQFGTAPGGPNYLGAAQATGQADMNNYNAQQASRNNMLSGLMNLGGAYMFSDERLKTDIGAVGTLNNGLQVYKYRYKNGGPMMIGVMAHEVEKINPGAVITHNNGYKMVDYSKI